MEMLEGNVFIVSNKQCTVEFQPSADMSWQSWANNELNQAATYPSPYANVSKGNMCTMGATIGMGEEDLFKPYTLEVRNSHVKRVNEFMISLPSSLSEKNRHSRKLQFMAENGIRQLPYLPVYKSTFYCLKIGPKNRPRLIHGSKSEIKKLSGQISIIIV